AASKQRHRPLDAPGHQVAVRRLAECEPELAAQVPGRHMRAAGERVDVQRFRVLPVDPVADAAEQREIAQVVIGGGSAGHLQIVPCRCAWALSDRAETAEAARGRLCSEDEGDTWRLGGLDALDGGHDRDAAGLGLFRLLDVYF